MNFILVCKEGLHTTLYEEVDLLSRLEDGISFLRKQAWNGRFHEITQYQYASSLPLRAGADALRVNWCEITVIHEQTGEILYKSAFITNFSISECNVAQIVRSGRARWKNENEGYNTLKTQGYNIEHNFGHGEFYLSMYLLSLNLLAFLTHTFMEISDSIYRSVRRVLGPRKTF